VRRARADDLPRVIEIERACFGRDAYPRNLFADYLRECGELFLVSTAETGVTGYIIACFQKNRAELVSIAISPGARHSGIGSALLRSAFRRLRIRSVERIYLMVHVENSAAVAFYGKHAFRRTGRIREYYGPGRDAWRMSRLL
jgi:ribosomal-protein-alanine N-acetyltransferase